jgi:hypothetical protein
MPPPKMLVTSTCSCRSRCSSSSARPTRSFRCGRRLSQLHWLRHAPALASCSRAAASRTLRWQPSEERDPADNRAQPQRTSMKRPALATPCPPALRSAAACTRTGTGTRARSRPAPRACPEHYTPPLPRRQGQLRRVDRRNHQVLRLNDCAAHMRIALSYSEPQYLVTMPPPHIVMWEWPVRRAFVSQVQYHGISSGGKYDLYYHHITVRKCHKRA